MKDDFKKEIKQMALFWFLLPLITISAVKTFRKVVQSWRIPKDMWE